MSGVVLADQIKSLDWKVRRAGFICAVSAETVGEVLEKTLTLIERTSVSKSSSNPDFDV